MAVTQGQGNPDWTEEETILALDLYLASGKKAVSKHDQTIHDLSALLQKFPWPEGTQRNDKFRNNEGVAMKVYNLRSVELGRGLRNTKMNRQVWGKYGDKPELVRVLATQIREALGSDNLNLSEAAQENVVFVEGRVLTAGWG